MNLIRLLRRAFTLRGGFRLLTVAAGSLHDHEEQTRERNTGDQSGAVQNVHRPSLVLIHLRDHLQRLLPKLLRSNEHTGLLQLEALALERKLPRVFLILGRQIVPQRFLRPRAAGIRKHLPVFKVHQRRERFNLKLFRHGRFRLRRRVHREQFQITSSFRFHLRCQSVPIFRHRFTVAAPRGVKLCEILLVGWFRLQLRSKGSRGEFNRSIIITRGCFTRRRRRFGSGGSRDRTKDQDASIAFITAP